MFVYRKCGDFNINLLKYNKNQPTKEFVDMMYSFGLYPLISKPTRITSEGATLIDNIFTNDIDCTNTRCNGLLITDISDHLPVFVICNREIKRNNVKTVKYIRSTNNECITALKQDLLLQNWSCVYDGSDVNESYDKFLNIFNDLYNKNCPVKRKVFHNNVNKDMKPWFTKGLVNATKKKNTLYKQVIVDNTEDAKLKYKKYKNKLTSILRNCERSYYSDLLEKHKSDVKETWCVLNTIIKRNNRVSSYPEVFIHNNKKITKKFDIANGFNTFFTNVGPNLAKEIVEPQNGNISNYLKGKNESSMFVYGTSEKRNY